jgi:hypothetical protein
MVNQGLLAPKSYWDLSESEKYEITNGCGPQRASGFVPNTIFGANLKPACDIHDYIYTKPESMISRKDADDLFLENMKKIIKDQVSFRPFRTLAEISAFIYYMSVRLFGDKFFSH